MLAYIWFFLKMGHSRPLFLYFPFFNTVDSKHSIYIFVDDGIRTSDLWSWKQQLYQLSDATAQVHQLLCFVNTFCASWVFFHNYKTRGPFHKTFSFAKWPQIMFFPILSKNLGKNHGSSTYGEKSVLEKMPMAPTILSCWPNKKQCPYYRIGAVSVVGTHKGKKETIEASSYSNSRFPKFTLLLCFITFYF